MSVVHVVDVVAVDHGEVPAVRPVLVPVVLRYGGVGLVEVEGPTVERWADGVAGEHGFTAVSHTLEIFGTCPDC